MIRGKEIPIMVLCGSRRFKKIFEEVAWSNTIDGYIVLSLHVWNHGIYIKKELDDIQRKKIEMADIVGIICPNNYIGESTAKELEYAEKLNKLILFYDKDGIGHSAVEAILR